MKIIRKIIEFLLGTSIIWIPIVGSIIAEKLSQIITMEQIMTVVYISIPILFIAIIKDEIDGFFKKDNQHGNAKIIELPNTDQSTK